VKNVSLGCFYDVLLTCCGAITVWYSFQWSGGRYHRIAVAVVF